MSTKEKELSLLEYVTLFTQKGMAVLEKIRNQADLLEEDEVYLKAVHDNLWYPMNYEIVVSEMVLSAETAVQQGLFADKTTVIDPHDDLGTAVAPPKSNQKTKKNEQE